MLIEYIRVGTFRECSSSKTEASRSTSRKLMCPNSTSLPSGYDLHYEVLYISLVLVNTIEILLDLPSGAKYSGVPQKVCVRSSWPTTFDNPKSVITI